MQVTSFSRRHFRRPEVSCASWMGKTVYSLEKPEVEWNKTSGCQLQPWYKLCSLHWSTIKSLLLHTPTKVWKKIKEEKSVPLSIALSIFCSVYFPIQGHLWGWEHHPFPPDSGATGPGAEQPATRISIKLNNKPCTNNNIVLFFLWEHHLLHT